MSRPQRKRNTRVRKAKLRRMREVRAEYSTWLTWLTWLHKQVTVHILTDNYVVTPSPMQMPLINSILAEVCDEQ